MKIPRWLGIIILSSTREEGDMAQQDWGLCRGCKWWQIEPDATVGNTTLGFCIDENLVGYKLRVSGDSGCNHFMSGEPARAKGSAKAPPSAEPQR